MHGYEQGSNGYPAITDVYLYALSRIWAICKDCIFLIEGGVLSSAACIKMISRIAFFSNKVIIRTVLHLSGATRACTILQSEHAALYICLGGITRLLVQTLRMLIWSVVITFDFEMHAGTGQSGLGATW